MIVETHDLQPIRRPQRPRWMMPLAATVAALALGIGGVVGAYLVGNAGAGLGNLAAWAPADSVVYAEVDLTLPGPQRDNLRAILDRWPAVDPEIVVGDGFADWADELLSGTDPAVTYSTDLAPWLSGHFATILGTWPVTPTADQVRGVIPAWGVIVGSRDAAAATAFTDRMRALAVEDGFVAFSSADHGGVTVWTLDTEETMSQFVDNAEFSYAVTDGAVVLASGADQMDRLLAAHAGAAPNLAEDGDTGRLVAALPADRVGLAVVDTRAWMQAAIEQLRVFSPETADSFESFATNLPGRSVTSLSFESDRVVGVSVNEAVDGPFALQALSEPLAERIPADALAYGSVANLGDAIGFGIDAFLAGVASDPISGDFVGGWIEGFEGQTGIATRDLLGWADDTAFFGGWDGSQPYGGLIALTDDPDAAAAQVEALVDAAVREAASAIEIEREAIGGVEVIRMTGGDGFTMEIALADDSVTLTIGSGVAARLQALEAASSLAGVERFATAIGEVGGSATSPSVWVDLAGILNAVAAAIPESDRSPFDMFVKPNLEPLDFVAASAHEAAGLVISRADLVLR